MRPSSELARSPGPLQRREAIPVHVIAYQPPGRRTRRRFPVGTWNMQELAAWKAAEPAPGGDWSHEAPREANLARLAGFASGVLGYPVILECTLTRRPGRLPFVTRPELVCYITPRRDDGPDVLSAWVHGDGIPQLRAAALGEGARLYGPGAQLAVERVGKVANSSSSKGGFYARVTVRCVNFAGLPGEGR